LVNALAAVREYLNEDVFQSTPKYVFPEQVLLGDSARVLNVPKMEGTHTTIELGILAAEAAYGAFRITPHSRDKAITIQVYERDFN
jgi:flavin-dependent dehydrogenase